ncbi:MAG: sulfite oxidase heme-binding subunit YedZ [Candidatus Acidiferrales bacterium]
MNSILTSKWTKVGVFLLCLVPLGILILRAAQGNLTANPIEFITHTTGDWTLRFLVITLSISPLRKILRLPQLIRFRRMFGLFAFFYAFLHFSTWIGLDKFFDWTEMWKDVQKRRFITVGFTGFVLMIPLAVTSTAGWIRRLGGKRWQMLHRAIYLSAVAGVIHYYWLVKSDVRKPLQYAAMVGVLLAWRLGSWISGRGQRIATGSAPHTEITTAESA